jgi:hypothetical protein
MRDGRSGWVYEDRTDLRIMSPRSSKKVFKINVVERNKAKVLVDTHARQFVVRASRYIALVSCSLINGPPVGSNVETFVGPLLTGSYHILVIDIPVPAAIPFVVGFSHWPFTDTKVCPRGIVEITKGDGLSVKGKVSLGLAPQPKGGFLPTQKNEDTVLRFNREPPEVTLRPCFPLAESLVGEGQVDNYAQGNHNRNGSKDVIAGLVQKRQRCLVGDG